MKKKSINKNRRANITNYFLELIKEGSAQDIKTFYSYFNYDLNLFFEENISTDIFNNPLRLAYIRGDSNIFNQIIKLNPNLFAKNQANERALQYAVQFNDIDSTAVLLMNRQNRELTIKTANPEFHQLFADFKQLTKDEFNSKYRAPDIQCQFFLPDLPIELQCKVLEHISPGLALNSRSVCKLWRDNIKKPDIMDNTFVKARKFESYSTTEDYFLKIEIFPTIHHFCLADPKRILPKIAPKDYDDAFLKFVDDLIGSAVLDCLHPDRQEEFRDFILNFDAEEIYYWNWIPYGMYSLYLKVDEDFGVGITLVEPVWLLKEGNFSELDAIYG